MNRCPKLSAILTRLLKTQTDIDRVLPRAHIQSHPQQSHLDSGCDSMCVHMYFCIYTCKNVSKLCMDGCKGRGKDEEARPKVQKLKYGKRKLKSISEEKRIEHKTRLEKVLD